MKEYVIEGKVVKITLEDGKVVKAGKQYLDNMVSKLGIDMEEAVLTWLEDEGYLVNDEQEELCTAAKNNKVLASLHRTKDEKPKAQKKTQTERVRKENPTKEMVIAEIAQLLPKFAEDVVIENKGKIITFRIGDQDFKLDLIQKRKKKNV